MASSRDLGHHSHPRIDWSESRTLPAMSLVSLIEAERARRDRAWRELVGRGGPLTVSPKVLRELGIYGGAQGGPDLTEPERDAVALPDLSHDGAEVEEGWKL